MITVAGWLFVLAALFAVGFQLALAAGAPWGELAMGGRVTGRFPPRLRIAAVVQGALIAALAAIVATRAGLLATPLDAAWLIRLAVAFSAASLFVNAISRSPRERRLWVPVAIVMLGSSLIVAVA